MELPKIVKHTIKKEDGRPFQTSTGYELKVVFDINTIPPSDYRHHYEYSAYLGAVASLLNNWPECTQTQVRVSPDCPHFIDNFVTMFFLTREAAEEALSRLKRLSAGILSHTT